MKAYPTPIDQPVAPVDDTVVSEHDSFYRETRENDNSRSLLKWNERET